MLSPKVKQYLEQLVPERNDLLQEIEEEARLHQIPIMELISMQTMLQMMKIIRPKKILEIGTAIGYSALRMADVFPEAEIYTIERDQERYERALMNIERAHCSERIHVTFGDALLVSEQLAAHAPFDMLFIDAAKGQYKTFFETYSQQLTDEAVIFSDNVLFRGYVAGVETDLKCHEKMAAKVNAYNDWLLKQEQYDTSIIPVGDGLALTIKKTE